MGYRGHEDWKDMSDFVVHFTKLVPIEKIKAVKRKNPEKPTAVERMGEFAVEQRKRDRTGYYPWIDILGQGRLRAGGKPLGAARNIARVEDLHRVVCFSEIPLDQLDRLIERRSLYGIGFRKDTIVAKGGGPLWYLDKDSAQAKVIKKQIDAAKAGGADPDDPRWQLTPFIDHPGDYAGRPYRFEWEREWRVVGDVAFAPEEVAFLFLPEEDHDRARQFFADAEVEHSGPVYLGAYVDPRWDMDRIQDALKNVPEAPEPSESAVPWWL